MIFQDGYCFLQYDYHFIIKNSSKEFEIEFNCFGENTEKYKPFSGTITKEVKRIYKNRKEITKTISYKLKCIGSTRFFPRSLSNLVNNFTEGVHKLTINIMDVIIKNVKHVELNTKIARAVLNTQTLIY